MVSKGQVLSSPSLLPKFVFIAIYHKYLQGMSFWCTWSSLKILTYLIIAGQHSAIWRNFTVLLRSCSICIEPASWGSTACAWNLYRKRLSWSCRMPNNRNKYDWPNFTNSIGSYNWLYLQVDFNHELSDLVCGPMLCTAVRGLHLLLNIYSKIIDGTLVYIKNKDFGLCN